MSNNDSVKFESPVFEVKLPSINSNKKQFNTNSNFQNRFVDQESENELISDKILRNLKYESEQLLEKVRSEYSHQEESSIHETSYTSIPFMPKQPIPSNINIHLDNEEKAKIIKSIVIDPFNNELDFESSVSSKLSKNARSRQTKLRKDLTSNSDKNLSSSIFSSQKKIEDIFSKPKEIKIKHVKDYFKKKDKPIKLNPEIQKRSESKSSNRSNFRFESVYNDFMKKAEFAPNKEHSTSYYNNHNFKEEKKKMQELLEKMEQNKKESQIKMAKNLSQVSVKF